MNSPPSRRGSFNRFQTFSYGAFVPTSMDAHFDPYREPAVTGKLRRQMENIPRLTIAASGQPAASAAGAVTAARARAAHN